MNSRKRIVMTTDCYWPRINGVTVAVEGFRRMLTRLGHDVFVCAPDYGFEDPGLPADDDQIFRYRAFSFPLSREDRLAWPDARFRVTRLLTKLRPDVVHSHTEFTVGFAGKRYCMRTGTPHVMTCHAYWESYFQSYIPWIPRHEREAIIAAWSRADYRLVDYLTVPCDFLKRLIRSYGVCTPIEVLPNGVDPAEFCLSPQEREDQARYFAQAMPRTADRRLLLYAGRIAREKNIDFLFDVLERVVPAVPDVLLLLAGDGPYRAALERRAAQEGLGGHVHFAGYLNRKRMAHAYAIADAFVFSSKTETQGLVLGEAMTCGTPVVAVRAQGTEDYLPRDEGGFLLEEDAGRFADTVIRLLRDEVLRRQKKDQARRAAQRWTLQRTTQLLLGVYERAAEACATRRRAAGL